MTPEDMARLHARAIATPAPWDALTFAAFRADPAIRVVARDQGFVFLRIAADEAEVLTLAVAPEARRRGLGRELLAEALGAAAAEGVAEVFLEVAADNPVAIGLYRSEGFAEVGIRTGYYLKPSGERVDALVLRRAPGGG